jgi:FtsH-binding integral membrane protein
MATVAARPENAVKVVPNLPGRRYDHFFFSSTAWLMLATVFVGFAPTYYLAGVFHAPLPSMIIHVHGAAFTCWMLLLVTQTSLVAAGRTDIHRRLGIGGFVLACLMVILGVMAATDSLVREAGPPGRDAKVFYIVPMTAVFAFGVLIIFAYRNRKDSPAHKRLIFVATTSLMVAAVARWPWALVHRRVPMATLVSYIFLVMLVGYDLWSMRRIHRATLWAGGFLVIAYSLRLPIGQSAAWHTFAGWVQHAAR